MELSNVEKIRSFTIAFDRAVDRLNFVPPKEKWDNEPNALEVAMEIKEFGADISYNTELYNNGFLKHVNDCFAKVADEPRAAQAREVLQSIPGMAYTPSNA